MILLLPVLEGEELRSCRCQSLGLVSAVDQRSHFRPHKLDGRVAYYDKKCKSCNKRTKAVGELRRIDAVLARERKGTPLPKVKPGPGSSGILYPIGPFRDWLERLMARARSAGSGLGSTPESWVANSLGITTRTLRRYLKEDNTIDECALDRCLTRHGTLMIGDIYPDGQPVGNIVEAGSELPPARSACASPGCSEPAVGRFCASHSAQLGKVRDELALEAQRVREKVGRKGAKPTCCAPGCDAARVPPARYCASCQDDGWEEHGEDA